MKSSILTLDVYDAVKELDVLISYKNNISNRMQNVFNFDEILSWKYAYRSYMGMCNIDFEDYFTRIDFITTLHLCLSKQYILECAKLLYADNKITGILAYTNSAMVLLLNDPSYYANVYELNPRDHIYDYDKYCIQKVLETGIDPVYA